MVVFAADFGAESRILCSKCLICKFSLVLYLGASPSSPIDVILYSIVVCIDLEGR